MTVFENSKKASKLRPSPLTPRDKDILRTIYEFDGMMGAEQIQRLFFTSWYRTRLRMSKLFNEGYVNHPDRKLRAALPQTIFWLTRKGAEVVAGMDGKSLQDFKWRKKIRWGMVAHDLEVNDFEIAVLQACGNEFPFVVNPARKRAEYIELTEWTPGGVFWAHPDKIEYTGFDGQSLKRGVRPDGYFVLHNRQTGRNIRCLLELDKNSNESLPTIADEKILPGLAYLTSDVYQRRAGRLPGEKMQSGRWLFVISTANAELRLSNMKRKIEQIAGENADKFWLTTLNEVLNCENVLTTPIWRRGGQAGMVSLLG